VGRENRESIKVVSVEVVNTKVVVNMEVDQPVLHV
jgi:hypothetical protein